MPLSLQGRGDLLDLIEIRWTRRWDMELPWTSLVPAHDSFASSGVCAGGRTSYEKAGVAESEMNLSYQVAPTSRDVAAVPSSIPFLAAGPAEVRIDDASVGPGLSSHMRCLTLHHALSPEWFCQGSLTYLEQLLSLACPLWVVQLLSEYPLLPDQFEVLPVPWLNIPDIRPLLVSILMQTVLLERDVSMQTFEVVTSHGTFVFKATTSGSARTADYTGYTIHLPDVAQRRQGWIEVYSLQLPRGVIHIPPQRVKLLPSPAPTTPSARRVPRISRNNFAR